MNPQDLLRIAEGLARGALSSGRGRPRQAELRRAVSAAYYALFHTLALCGASTLVGAARFRRLRSVQDEKRLTMTWRRAGC